jgi:hypothetical protein
MHDVTLLTHLWALGQTFDRANDNADHGDLDDNDDQTTSAQIRPGRERIYRSPCDKSLLPVPFQSVR